MEHPQSDSAAATPVAPVPAATTMRAIVQDAYGDADQLRLDQIPAPAVGVDDVLIGVRAAGVHIGDWHVMTGQPYLMRIMGFGFRAPKARVRGMDVAGTVEAVGANVTRFRVGDEVYGICDGAFAEYATARVDDAGRQTGESDLRAGRGDPHLGLHGAAGAPRRRKDHRGAAGA